ncbi:MAG: thiamine pyrophosphate-binding protein [SAR202 cluster bacterium]|nr:thiamine pyrophosphate-binding protein [SAR202 cluster bacterium]
MGSNRTLTGSHLITRALQLEGVENIFTLAGDHVLPALDVASDAGFRLIDTRHEQAAVHMADSWGRITGQPGVAMYTTPGFANAIPGLASAYHAESPLLSISGSAELSELGRGAMQEIDQVSMARPITKGTWMVTDVRRIPHMIAQALRVAYSGRRGPVHLTIPIDIQQQAVSEDEVDFYNPAEYRSSSPLSAPSEAIHTAIELLRGASRPIIIAGSAAAYARSGDALQRLIETTRIPILTEGDARGLISDDHQYSYGFFDAGLNQAAKMLGTADFVVLVGRKQDIILGYGMSPTISPDAKIIQIDPSEAEIGRNRGVSLGIVGDIEAIAGQLTEEASRHSWSDLPWLKELQQARDEQVRFLESLAVSETPMHAMFVHKTVSEILRDDDSLAFDGGDFCHFGKAYHPSRTPKSWSYLSPMGMLGSALPAAMTAKLAYPERRSIMFTGDGAFGFNGMEFDTAVRHHLPVVAIMGNDAAWGIDRQIQLQVFGKPVVTDLLPTRYDKVVEGLGGHSEHVEEPSDLAPALQRAFDSGRPSLVNIGVQRGISPRAEASIKRWKSDTVLPF